jgi:L-fuculose-phosphate aldolase
MDMKRSQYIDISKNDFCRFCNLLYERHLVSGVGGNVSARTGDFFYITPSGVSMRDMRPELVVAVNKRGNVKEGGTPSKESEMHLSILKKRPDINVVNHIHGAHIIAASCLMKPGPDTIPALTPGFVHYAYPLEMLPFSPPGSKELTENVLEKITSKESKSVLLQNHGLVTLGTDFSEALSIAEEIDEAAKIFVFTNNKGNVISPQYLKNIKS